jgi:filamentous hemagglutinin
VASSNANITIGATSNVAVFATTGAYITGIVSATGNAVANNVIATTISNAASFTGGLVSVTGNITGANVITGSGATLINANVSTTGNVTANNGQFTTIVNTASFTGSTVSVTGNITGANVNISTSGTLTTPRILYNDGGIRTLTGNTAVTLDFATDSMVSLTNPTNTVTITLANYVAGASITFICSSATARQINTGVAAAVNSTTGAANINAGGGGIGPNQSVILRYYCVSGNAATTYVSASYQ